MAAKPLPDQALLLKLLRYEPDTGKLFWRERTPDMFTERRRFRPEVACAQWNTRYANREAMATKRKDGYRRSTVNSCRVFVHRAIWCMVYGVWPREQIDHINGRRDDNRIENLRAVSRSTNMKNTKMPCTNSSGRIGVYPEAGTGRWTIKFREGRKTHHLGGFLTFEEACAARAEAESANGYHLNHGRNPIK